jgi:hypothetical protein
VIHSTPMLTKDNPGWAIANVPETPKVPGLGMLAPYGTTQRGQRPAATRVIRVADAGDAIRRAVGIVAAWLAGLPRRAGRYLFAMNDMEAGWRGWQVIELSGGLRRQYRDLRFLSDTAAERPPVPPVPEAWDDHWDGRSLGSAKDDPPGRPLDGDD